jgi:acyl-CoA oxidase
MKEMHASSSGLKALCTLEASQGLEDCRKCCGGHGVLLSSGIASLTQDYTTLCTAEVCHHCVCGMPRCTISGYCDNSMPEKD